MSDIELRAYFNELMDDKRGSLAFCSDTEGLQIDSVIGVILVSRGYSGLYNIISDR